MELVVVMAGEGKRFTDKGFTVPKPLIEVKGKTILDWTMTSVGPWLDKNPLSFAIRAEHDDKYQLADKLKAAYGPNIHFQKFSKTTRGNLDTALITSEALLTDKSQAVAFLDSDNKYDVVNFQSLLEKINDKDFGILCYFKLLDKNDLKWAFCAVDPASHRVSEIKEKEMIKNGQPMIGFFYWSSVGFFEKIAKEVFAKEQPKKNNEYFMSQAYDYAIKQNYPVYAFESATMVPLGTPEDLEAFAKSDN